MSQSALSVVRPVLALAIAALLAVSSAGTLAAPRDYRRNVIRNLLAVEKKMDRRAPSALKDPQAAEWAVLKSPFRGNRPRGLAAIRKMAQTEGAKIVVEGKRPASMGEAAADEMRFGLPLVYEGDVPKGTTGKGVAFHPMVIDYANKYRGRVNPHMGFGQLHGIMNKRNEYRFAEAVRPGSMAQTVFGEHLLAGDAQIRADLALVRRAYQHAGTVTAADRERLRRVVERLFVLGGQKFPEGAFIKLSQEYQTGDNSKMIITGKTAPGKLVGRFLADMTRLQKELGDFSLADPKVQRRLADWNHRGTNVVAALLRAPDTILVQKKLDIAKSPLGHIMEFRVDFVDGEAVRSEPRHSWEFMPGQASGAAAFLNSFFSRAPKQFRYLSGGADVVMLRDGTYRFIEFNFGPESGFIYGWENPVGANRYMTGLLGKPTPMIAHFEEVSKQSLSKQRTFFRSLRKDTVLADAGDPTFSWFRDNALKQWTKNPTKEAAQETLRRLKAWSRAMGTETADRKESITSAQMFMDQALAK